MATPTQAQRRQPVATASGRKCYVKFQSQVAGVWTDVAGLGHVPVTFRTFPPFRTDQVLAAQMYPVMRSWAYMRWRPSMPVKVGMHMVYGTHIYRIHDVANWDESNTDIILYLEEWQPTGTTRT